MQGSYCRLCRALTVVWIASFVAGVDAQPTPQTATPPKVEQKAADTAALPSARSIIDRHIEAIGGRKAFAGHKSLRVQGTMKLPGDGCRARSKC